MRRSFSVFLVTISVLVTTCPPALADPAAVGEARYQASIRRTSNGVAHVLARDLASAGFGQGYAYAEDRFCDLADQVVKVRGERARWHGRGAEDAHLVSDVGYRALGLVERARQQLPKLSADARSLVDGYVAGFNTYLARKSPQGVGGWCAGKPWIAPITTVDLLAYHRDLAINASGAALLPAIAVAQPPGADRQRMNPAAASRLGDAMRGTAGRLGSNAWAVGAQRSANRQGALVANPHFPWQGEHRFWENQLTVPGKLNVYGASLGGLPGVQIGFTEHLAWTHTVAPGQRFTLYSLKLTPGDPTSYTYDGRAEKMTAKPVTVAVREPGGQVREITRTTWSTRYGPVVDGSAVDPSLGWSTTSAVTYRDANIDNDRLVDFWLALGRSRTVVELAWQHVRYGTPWTTTVAADRWGTTWFGNAAATPHLTEEGIRAWLENPLGVLDGGNPRHEWRTAPGAAAPGLLPAPDWPQLTTRDVVFNANNSHWVAHPRRRLNWFSPLLGAEQAPLSPRARLAALAVADTSATGPSGSDGRFDLDELLRLPLANDSLSAKLLLGPVRAGCPAELDKACDVLRRWDGTFDVDSRGAVLGREMFGRILAEHPDALTGKGPLFSTPFDPADPLGTPGTPKPDPTVIGKALAKASHTLESAGLPLDVALGDVQATVKAGRRIPVPGATHELGALNIASYSDRPGTSLEPVIPPGFPVPGSELTTEGYVVNSGTSFLMAVRFTARGPVAKGLLTFSQSADPNSPHHADQTDLYSRGGVREFRFTEQAINADPALKVARVSG